MRPSFNTAGPCSPGEHDIETEGDALDQVADYLDIAGLDEGFLVMFDLRRDASWQDKLMVRDVTHTGRRIRIFGCFVDHLEDVQEARAIVDAWAEGLSAEDW